MATLTIQSVSFKKTTFQFLTMALAAFLLFSSNAFAAKSDGWQNQNLKVKGQWSLEEKNGETYLTLSDQFKTKNAPDLKLFLSKNSYEDIKGSNATDAAVLIAPLKSTKGAQTYKIPANIDINDYQSLVLHCEQYSKLWASTPIK